jgi:hypothetical protein
MLRRWPWLLLLQRLLLPADGSPQALPEGMTAGGAAGRCEEMQETNKKAVCVYSSTSAALTAAKQFGAAMPTLRAST